MHELGEPRAIERMIPSHIHFKAFKDGSRRPLFWRRRIREWIQAQREGHARPSMHLLAQQGKNGLHEAGIDRMQQAIVSLYDKRNLQGMLTRSLEPCFNRADQRSVRIRFNPDPYIGPELGHVIDDFFPVSACETEVEEPKSRVSWGQDVEVRLEYL